MREGTNERTYTTTKNITTLLLRSRVKNLENSLSQKNKVAYYHLENEFSTFSTLDIPSNEFSTR